MHFEVTLDENCELVFTLRSKRRFVKAPIEKAHLTYEKKL